MNVGDPIAIAGALGSATAPDNGVPNLPKKFKIKVNR